VGGPAGFASLGQLKGVYAHFGVPMPLIMPRATASVVDSSTRRTLGKIDVPLAFVGYGITAKLNLASIGEAPKDGKAAADSKASAAQPAPSEKKSDAKTPDAAAAEELKKDAPSAAGLQANSAKINTLSAQLPRWFPKGSGPEAGVKTGAKAEIWSDAAGFGTAARNFQTQAGQLQKIAAAA